MPRKTAKTGNRTKIKTTIKTVVKNQTAIETIKAKAAATKAVEADAERMNRPM